ncbi:hypothetical protein HDU84_006916, partial [Entophlyctis sp. JEL0112]
MSMLDDGTEICPTPSGHNKRAAAADGAPPTARSRTASSRVGQAKRGMETAAHAACHSVRTAIAPGDSRSIGSMIMAQTRVVCSAALATHFWGSAHMRQKGWSGPSGYLQAHAEEETISVKLVALFSSVLLGYTGIARTTAWKQADHVPSVPQAAWRQPDQPAKEPSAAVANPNRRPNLPAGRKHNNTHARDAAKTCLFARQNVNPCFPNLAEGPAA